jgi:4-hydroxybenzoate polyprenyltransferase
MRALPAGTLSNGFVAGFVVVSIALFVLGAAMLNRLTLELAPVALLVVLAYSYMKRVTRWSHIVLGLALGIAPSAAWIAVRGSLDARIIVLTAAVLLWVGGFDVLYACQDFEHDRSVGLNSVPQAFGITAAFWIARSMHVGMLLMLCWLMELFGLGPIAMLGVALVAGLLFYEHSIISPKDLRRMNAAFFTLNGLISVVFFMFVAADVLMRK